MARCGRVRPVPLLLALRCPAGHACIALVSVRDARLACDPLSLHRVPRRAASSPRAHLASAHEPHVRQDKLCAKRVVVPAWRVRLIPHTLNTHMAVWLDRHEAGCVPLTRADHTLRAQRTDQRGGCAAQVDRAACSRACSTHRDPARAAKCEPPRERTVATARVRSCARQLILCGKCARAVGHLTPCAHAYTQKLARRLAPLASLHLARRYVTPPAAQVAAALAHEQRPRARPTLSPTLCVPAPPRVSRPVLPGAAMGQSAGSRSPPTTR